MEEFDVVVIGSGPGGYVAAIRAAQLGLKTACVEKDPPLGGTCLNVGCIPSKTLLHATETLWKLRHNGQKMGLKCPDIGFDFPVMQKERVDVIQGFNKGIEGLFKKNKITRFLGLGSFLSPQEINVQNGSEKTVIRAKNTILATGSEPVPLPFLPFDEKTILSSTGALALEKVPSSLLVVGAGVIGVELGSVYSRLGTKVQFIEFLDRICPTMDAGISMHFQQILRAQGMQFSLSTKVIGGTISENRVQIQVEGVENKEKQTHTADAVLVSIGRRPYSKGLALEKAGLALTPKGQLAVDNNFRTSHPSIYGIGDLIDGPMLAHKASEEGVAVAEIIAGQKPSVHYIAVPNVIYTFPEVAAVGLTEEEAKGFGLPIRTGTFYFKANSRARCNAEEEGFIKILAHETTDRIVGIHILGPQASELIAACTIAVHEGLTADELAAIPFAHPTLAEAIKEAALATKKRAIHS